MGEKLLPDIQEEPTRSAGNFLDRLPAGVANALRAVVAASVALAMSCDPQQAGSNKQGAAEVLKQDFSIATFTPNISVPGGFQNEISFANPEQFDGLMIDVLYDNNLVAENANVQNGNLGWLTTLSAAQYDVSAIIKDSTGAIVNIVQVVDKDQAQPDEFPEFNF